MLHPQKVLYVVHECLGHDGFGDVTVESRREHAFAIPYHGQRGDGHQRDLSQPVILLQTPGYFKPINAGKLNVANNQLRLPAPGQLQSREPVGRGQRGVAEGFQQITHQL